MRRPRWDRTSWLVAVGGATVLAVALGGCAQSARLDVVGTVRDDTVTVTVPALGTVQVDLNAGFVPTPPATTAPSPAASAAPAIPGPVSVVGVRDIPRQEGDRVSAGDVVATLDDSQLAAQLAVAQSAAEVAAAQPAVVQGSIDRTDDKAAEIAGRRADVRKAIATLTAKRRALLTNRATLVEARGRLRDKRAALRRARTDLRAQRAQLRAKKAEALDKRAQLARQVNELHQLLAKLPPDPATPLPPLPQVPRCRPCHQVPRCRRPVRRCWPRSPSSRRGSGRSTPAWLRSTQPW